MYLDDERLVLSPSDLVAHLCCPHVTELELEVVRGLRSKPAQDDPEVAVVQRRGIEHERRYLDALVASGARVTEIPDGPLAQEVAATLDALAAGVDVVYQAAFLDSTGDGPAWRGHADFCHRIGRPSALGDHAYEPSDTKLAHHVRPSAVLQLCEYAAQLGRIQGVGPEQVHVVLGGSEGRRETLRSADFAAYHRAAKRRFADAASGGVSSYPLPNSHCPVCPWLPTCEDRWRADDHLVRVAGLGVEQARKFEAAGVPTLAALARFSGGRVSGIADATVDKLRHQARLQHAAVAGRPPPFELLDTAADGRGLGALPAPSPGDVFFDIEGDPFVGAAGLEYLFGVGWVDRGEFVYRAFWAHDAGAERRSLEAFIDLVVGRRAAHPGMHVYHFAPYETAAVTRLMGRYATREDEVDELLRAGVFVDLHRVVRQGVRVGTPSYSLKKLEALYMGGRTDAIVDGGSSIVEYERWLEGDDPAILAALERYNRTDCDSTRLLRDWLEERRGDYEALFGEAPPRPAVRDGSAPAGVEAEGGAVDALVEALAGPDGCLPGDDEDARALRLLGHLLEWHRREDKPAWWQYFRRVNDLDHDDLFDDTEAIAGLEYDGVAGTVARSTLYRYRFDPAQEHKLSEGDKPQDPDVERSRAPGANTARPGEIVELDRAAGTLVLKRANGSDAPHPRALVPAGPIRTPELRAALRRVAESVVAGGIDGPGPYRAVRDLLARRPPRLRGAPAGRRAPLVPSGADPTEASIALAGRLDHGCLAIQGPPGSGKTAAAARIAVALLADTKRVAVTANSHAVISHLLEEILGEAQRRGVAVSACQRGDKHQVLAHPGVTPCGDTAAVTARLDAGANLVAGTGWLFSRPDFDGLFDHLIVDEAGQMSLANTVAVGTCARNLVLVGDPRQLAQPSHGTHPEGADASALGHLLGSHPTMPEDLGVFLDHTHRLHPDICRFVSEIVYDGRLVADPDCRRQAVTGAGPLGGAGLRWHPVRHAGNRSASTREAEAVAEIYAELLGRSFVDRSGAQRPMTPDDILVVAPYNAQVSLLARTLPAGARVGTVDRFQGQQAPVVILSLATSSLDEIPRGMEFLYSRNRLNVAVSRAQALSIVVGSPALLSVRCNTVEQLRLANGLCRLVELAAPC